ncbi:aconitase X catalytic domain-containing protein [Schinkia azotoformans]|uniref:aconitase X catalytic domain-containing protein n=1 Tax=Schinkia azotoformans TaxID=1454 RepID=UPI002DBF725A|nr:aconitase X catalytic domain-containing protein [Schinkia azotoformans]MEC1715133.1 aconitase X catalytic domain-containing protein [Schinkia azotoformans]MEC1739817.1 aconitase X catalytic domain-containing protein [Schinkia azotoformans]MEC1745558.1 aconitase X catalytic domain-containing protein [Schinkia azotoformans]MEC1765058.1 aconitase X catalytic domain-containing protein [Schinkia azotoformans]MEC1770130.1 aconitase X catalytic domain-containing protein [Schinkia azotoformans]
MVTTTMNLSDSDKKILHGEEGEARQIAMRILIRIADIQGATEFVDITHAHIGGSLYTGPGSLKVIEKFAELGGKVKVPTTINAISIDRKRWREQGIDEEFAGYADRLARAFEKMGANPIFSCTPYIFPEGPKFGDNIVWAESNAIAYANSVIGARTNRHGDFIDICAALTGRAPLAGLHLKENRIGTFLVNVPELDEVDPNFYSVLGYLIGKHAKEDVPIVNGIKVKPTLEDLKSFSSMISTSGPVGIYHLVGVTPEAKTLEQALDGKEPIRILNVTKEELETVWKGLTTSYGAKLDLVLMGSPHFTLSEFQELTKLVVGKKIHSNIDFLITTNTLVFRQAEKEGWIEKIKEFGARFSTDICLCSLHENMFPKTTQTVLTNSGKFAHYGPGLINRGVFFGAMEDCVNSAILGEVVIGKPKWLN